MYVASMVRGYISELFSRELKNLHLLRYACHRYGAWLYTVTVLLELKKPASNAVCIPPVWGTVKYAKCFLEN